jgi:eukaryotic-like serine/threonine-protein kinase
MGAIGNYRIIRRIAEGGFAYIYQAEHMILEEKACIKQCKENSSDYLELLKQEAKILWKLSDHHSIPHTKDFLSAPDGSPAMVMSYIDGKSLEGMVSAKTRMHEEDACWVTQRLLEALYYCHYNAVIHGDVKPGNVLVEARKHDIKLIDFGLAILRPSKRSAALGYTEAFAAPEILQGKPPIPESDLYGAGMCMLYALGGDIPTKSLPKDISKHTAEYCRSLLRYDPMERPNWEKTDLVGKLEQIRQDVFGRRHTETYSRTRLA